MSKLQVIFIIMDG